MKAAAGAADRAATPRDTGGETAPVPRRQTMRAIVQAGYGSADVLHLAEIGQGPFAEYARARQDKLARKPASLTFGHAAVVAVSG